MDGQKRDPLYKIRVSKKDRIFLLEDSEDRIKWFKGKFPELVHAATVKEAIPILEEKTFDWLFLDHDLGLLDYQGYTVNGEGTGRDVARFLSRHASFKSRVVIHSWNPVGAAAMKDILVGATAIPFGQFDIDFV